MLLYINMNYLQRIINYFSKKTLNPNDELKRLLKLYIKSEDAIQNIIQKGADVNAIIDSRGRTMLMYALKFKASINIIKVLIENGADVNAIYIIDDIETSVLLYALKYKTSINIIKFIIEKISNLNKGTIITDALRYAILYKDSNNIINLLIETKLTCQFNKLYSKMCRCDCYRL